MKSICFFLSVIALGQAEIDWSKVTPIYVGPDANLSVSNNSVNPNIRVTGGVESVPHSRPYQVGLLLPLARGTSFCGGSLITRQTVLTAAHCVDAVVNRVEVILGAHRVQQRESSQKRLLSKRIIIHPQWNSQNLVNDVALIILPRSVQLNANIQLINLPPRRSSQNYVDQNALVSGWGRASDGSNSISPVLREVSVPIIQNSVCNERFFGSIVNSHICASGVGGRSSCNGDSGGPLVVNGVQVGIVSFGISYGCEAGWPSVYARTTSYNEWIHNNLV